MHIYPNDFLAGLSDIAIIQTYNYMAKKDYNFSLKLSRQKKQEQILHSN